MLTDSAKRHSSEDRLQVFFSPGPAAAYEIGHGKKRGPGRYIFPITLFLQRKGPHRRSELILLRIGKDDWAVDRLP